MWRDIDEVKESKCPRCLSMSLIEDDDEVIRLVSDFNFNEDGSIDDCGNSTIIPKCVVQESQLNNEKNNISMFILIGFNVIWK